MMKSTHARGRRLRRAARTRQRQAVLKVARLAVHLSGKHTYAQIIAPGAKVLAHASTMEKELKAEYGAGGKNGGNIAAAEMIGKRLAEKAVKAGVKNVGFDRGGWRYGGRIKSLAEAARAGGLSF